MDSIERGQVSGSAAEIYEEFFVPALFQEWGERVIRAAGVRAGEDVLDIACGTGVLARAAAECGASVVGLDVNDGMLAVAARKAPQIAWRQGRAEALPFDDASFDAVVSQFGLMFFEDRRTALQEMMRVLHPQGRLAVAVWDTLANTPGYAAMAALLRRLFGDQAANGLLAPYGLGDKAKLRALLAEAGIRDAEIETVAGTARFPSIEGWVFTDIKGWVLADTFDDEQFALLLGEAKRAPARFLMLLMLATAGLSAFLNHDIVCFVFAPVVAAALLKRRLNPVPFLIALAIASNIGAAATLVGNPQDMMIAPGRRAGLWALRVVVHRAGDVCAGLRLRDHLAAVAPSSGGHDDAAIRHRPSPNTPSTGRTRSRDWSSWRSSSDCSSRRCPRNSSP